MRRMQYALLWIAALFLLGGCSAIGGSTLDYSQVDVALSSDPASVQSEHAATLIASFTGVPELDDTEVTFDIRVKGKSKIVDAKHEGNSVFKASFTFPTAGTYYVYIHLYQNGEHITKLKRLEVL